MLKRLIVVALLVLGSVLALNYVHKHYCTNEKEKDGTKVVKPLKCCPDCTCNDNCKCCVECNENKSVYNNNKVKEGVYGGLVSELIVNVGRTVVDISSISFDLVVDSAVGVVRFVRYII